MNTYYILAVKSPNEDNWKPFTYSDTYCDILSYYAFKMLSATSKKLPTEYTIFRYTTSECAVDTLDYVLNSRKYVLPRLDMNAVILIIKLHDTHIMYSVNTSNTVKDLHEVIPYKLEKRITVRLSNIKYDTHFIQYLKSIDEIRSNYATYAKLDMCTVDMNMLIKQKLIECYNRYLLGGNTNV